MAVDEGRAVELLGTVEAYKIRGEADRDAGQAAYAELRAMGFTDEEIADAIRPVAPRPTPEPGIFDRVKSYFSDDEEQPELPEGEEQAVAPPVQQAPGVPAPKPPAKQEQPPVEEAAPEANSLFDRFVLMGKQAGEQSDPNPSIATSGDALDFAGKVLSKKTPVGAALTALDAFGKVPVLDPKGKFAKEYPTAFSLVNEVIEQPRQFYVGMTQRGPRETLKTLEALPEMVGGPAGEDADLARLARWAREQTVTDDLETPENQPQTTGQEIASRLGQGATGDLPIVMALMRALGPVAGMAAYTMLKQRIDDPMSGTPKPDRTPGPEGEPSLSDIVSLPEAIARNEEPLVAGAKGALQGGLGKAYAPFSRLVQAETMGGASAVDTLAQGGSLKDAFVSGVTMAGLAAQGPSGRVKGRQAISDSVIGDAARATGRGARTLYAGLGELPNEIRMFGERLRRERAAIATDPYADAYGQFIRQKPETRKQVRKTLEEIQAASGTPDVPPAPEEITNAVKAAELTEFQSSRPQDPTRMTPQQAGGIFGVVGGDSMPLVDLTTVDLRPDIYQFKRTGGSGVTDRLADATVFSPTAAENPPVLLYWDAPNRADGQQGSGRLIAVDSHHRVHLAHRLGAHDPVKAIIIDGAKVTPEQARHQGALQNIRLNSGTRTDAAKLFREAKMTADDLRAEGMSMSDSLIGDAYAISTLVEPLYQRVVRGEMKEPLAAHIGRELADPDAQNALVHLMNQRRKGQSAIAEDTVRELVRFINASPKGQARKSGQMMLGETQGEAFDPKAWGVGEDSFALEKATLSKELLKELRTDARSWADLARDRIKDRAGELGADYDAATAEENARIAGQIEETYKRLSTFAGPVSDILNEGAKRIRSGESVASIMREVTDPVRRAVMGEITGKPVGETAGEVVPDDTGTGDMFGSDAPRDTQTKGMFGTDGDPAADAQPPGDDGVIPPDAPPARGTHFGVVNPRPKVEGYEPPGTWVIETRPKGTDGPWEPKQKFDSSAQAFGWSSDPKIYGLDKYDVRVREVGRPVPGEPDTAPDAPPPPTFEAPKGKGGWARWTKEQRALSDEALVAEIEKLRGMAEVGADPKEVPAARARAILEKIAADRGVDVGEMLATKPKVVEPEVVPDDVVPTDEPADPLADMPEDQLELHQSTARSLTDADLKKAIDAYQRSAVLGDPEAVRIAAIYGEEMATRQKDRAAGEDYTYGTDTTPKPEPAWESAEAAEKFTAWLARQGDGELRQKAERWAAMRGTVTDPALLVRMDALAAEMERRGMNKPPAPPSEDATTPGSTPTAEERLRARARQANVESLERAIRHDEAKVERLPVDSKKRVALETRARILREVLAEKMGTVDPTLKGTPKGRSYEARLREHAQQITAQELVDLLATDRLNARQRPIYEAVLEERRAAGETIPELSVDKKKASTAKTGGKVRKRKSTDPEQLGRLGGIDPEDEPAGPNAYARNDGVIETDYDTPGVKAAPGMDPAIEIPTELPSDVPERTEPPEADEVPLGRTGWRSIFGLRRPANEEAVRELVRRSDIVRALAEKLKIPIRQGRISMRRALGIYKIRPEVIRARAMKDIATVAHEIGHHIDKRVFSNPPSGPMQGPFWNRRAAVLDTPASRNMRPPQARTFDAFRHELHPLATPGTPGVEGFAEFVSMYVVHPEAAAERAPSFYRFFEQSVRARAPEILDALLDARRDFERYRRQPALQMGLSNIAIGDHHDKPAGQRGFYHNWVEDIAPLREFRDKVAGPNARDRWFREMEWSQLDAMEDPYVLQRLLAGWVGKANAFIQKGAKGALDFATLERVHRPLEEALEGLRDANVLRVYMVARRTLEVGSRPLPKRVETGTPIELARQQVRDAEAFDPNIRHTFRELVNISDAALKYLMDSGVLTRAEYVRIRESNRDFVPLHRLMEDDVEAGFQKSKHPSNEKEVVDLHNPIYRLKGSKRDIIDPLESIIKNIYSYVYLAERNKVGQSLVELARRTQGSGFGVEEIPPDRVPVVQLSPDEIEALISRFTRREVSEEVRESVRQFSETATTVRGADGQPQAGGRQAQLIEGRVFEALRARGFAEGEARQMLDRIRTAPAGERETIIKETLEKVRIVEIKDEMQLALPESMVPIFRPGMVKKGEPIVSVRFQPTPRHPSSTVYLRLSPEIYQVVKGLDAESAGTLERVLSPLARTLRAGVVLSPEFAGPNIVRDQMTALLQSRNGFVPVFDLVRGIGHLLRNDEIAKDFYVSGGAMAEMTALDRKYLQRGVRQTITESGGQVTAEDMKKLGPLERWRTHMMNAGNRLGVSPRGTFLLTHPLEMLRVVSELSDNATRIGEYARGIRNAERAGVRNRREAMARAGYAAREVTIDFARAGAKARQVNKMIAFFNVAIQGPDRIMAAYKRDPAGFSLRAFLGITMPSAILWAMNKDDPRVEELDDRTKDLHWVIPTGTLTHEQWSQMSADMKAEYSIQHPVFLVPKPYEAGLIFGSFVERMLDRSYKKDPKAIQDWIGSVLSAVSPGVLPTAVGPLLEAALNVSFFRGAKLVPRSLEDVEAIEQRTGQTSETAVQIARALNQIPMPEWMGKSLGLQSPIKIENYIRGYLGGSGRLVTDVADAMMSVQNEVVDPETLWNERFLVKRFSRRFPTSQNKYIEEFYDYMGRATEAEATAQAYEKRGDAKALNDIHDRRKADFQLSDMLTAVGKALSDYRQVAEGYRRNPEMSAREKRVAIDTLTFQMIDLARSAVERARETEERIAREKAGIPLESLEEPDDPPPPAPRKLPPPPKPAKAYDPPDVTGALKTGELKPNELAAFADSARRQQQGAR